jgi:hypothetical protein
MPGDDAGLQRWLLEHYMEHQQFYRALLEQSPSVVSVNLPIQRMDDPKTWLAAHQMVSQSQWTGAGGGQSTDFGTLDWDDHAAIQDWMNIHREWHERLRDTLL